MHFSPARPRRVLRLALAAAVAACALPAAAQAAVVEEAADGSLRFRGSGGEANIVSVTTSSSNAVSIQDLNGVTSNTPLCAEVSTRRLNCAIGIRMNEILLGSGNDIIAVDVPNRVVVEGGFGNDTFDGGKGTDPTSVTFRGGDGFDVASYSTTDRSVHVTPTSFDGRIGFDQDIIAFDVERVVGSRFDDNLFNLNFNGEVSGGRGNDTLTANQTTGSITRFDMGRQADGGDRVVPGPSVNFINYSGRTLPVNVTAGFRGADDGEAGEGDDVGSRGSMIVDGGQAGDTLSTFGSAIAGSTFGLNGHGGIDTLEGGEAGEFMDGGPGSDTFIARGGNDFIVANDGVGDAVGCGLGDDDTARLDNLDGFSSCENRTVVGKLQLAPKAIRAKADQPVQVRLSWRHPTSWRELRKLELRLVQRGAPVGEVTIRPGKDGIRADGAIELVRRESRLSRQGRTVVAQLALRLDGSLAGQRLETEVEATDVRGARQLERG
jgi:hypothetical protein